MSHRTHQGLNRAEIAMLAGAPLRAVNKAIEERIIRPKRVAVRGGTRSPPASLAPEAAVYLRVITQLAMRLSRADKTNLMRWIEERGAKAASKSRFDLRPAVSVDLRRVAGEVGRDVARYEALRRKWITSNPRIFGGVPIVRGTRIPVYSLQIRIDGGEAAAAILEDYPHITAEALDIAVLYARANPQRGRPMKGLGRRIA